MERIPNPAEGNPNPNSYFPSPNLAFSMTYADPHSIFVLEADFGLKGRGKAGVFSSGFIVGPLSSFFGSSGCEQVKGWRRFS